MGGRLSYAVFDARSGALLEGQDPQQGLPPASVAKAVTAAFALERLGPDFRFTTRLLANGPIQGGVLQGDLTLLGGGDPQLGTDELAGLVSQLRAAGVSRIAGRFLVNGSSLPQIARIDPKQPEHVGYNPSISGLNLNFNRIHMEWKRGQQGWQVTMDARGKSHRPAVSLASARIADRQSPLFTYSQSQNGEQWTVASASLGKGGSRWLPTRFPELYAGEVFRAIASAQGISLPAPSLSQGQAQGQSIAQIQSPPMVEMLRDMLRHSTNLTAEVMGLRASGQGSLRASAAAMNEWARTTHGITADFVDHSGLGGASRISATAMAELLMRRPDLAQIMRAFPVAENGQGPKVMAKTGTLNFVSGLAGFIEGPRPMVFAIFTADTNRRDALSGAEMERPRGGPEWTRRARTLQAELIRRWDMVYAN